MRTGKWFALVALALATWACGGSRSEPVAVESEGMKLQVAVEPADLRVGKNSLWIELQDASGAPVAGADVDVKVHRHAMGAMPARGSTSRAISCMPTTSVTRGFRPRPPCRGRSAM